MSSATPTTPPTPRVTLTFQLDPVKLVATRVETAGAYGDPDDKGWKQQFLTSNLPGRTLERPLDWSDPTDPSAKPQAFKALVLALVRLKYILDLYADHPGTHPLLRGKPGSPAAMLKGVLDRSDPDALEWMRDFCGYIKAGDKGTFTLDHWFSIKKTTPRDKTTSSLDICCHTSDISADQLLIAIHNPKAPAAPPVLADTPQLLLIADALANLAKWGSPDTMPFPPKLPRSPLAPSTASATSTAPPLTDDALLAEFRDWMASVADKCDQVELRGIKLSSSRIPRLPHVYASLQTDTPRARNETQLRKPESAEQPGHLSALEALLTSTPPRVVLLGEPGSGKSTFVQYVTLFLADKLSSPKPDDSKFAGISDEVDGLLRACRALPVRIPLLPFSRGLTAADVGTSEDVYHHVHSQLAEHSHAAAPHLREVLTRGLALVMFDGLDEVPGALLPVVKRAIESFATGGFRKCRIAVTCRIASYRLPEFKLAAFPNEHTIVPLSPELRDRFVNAWYRQLSDKRTEYDAEAVSTAQSLIRALDTERLVKMASNPFFLTAMAALHRPEKQLPNSSAELMNELVEGILNDTRKRRGDAEDTDGLPTLLALLKEKGIDNGVKRLREQLQAIAYLARAARPHSKRGENRVEITLIRGCLIEIGDVDTDWVNRMILAMQHRAGVLQSDDGKQFQFPYKFEEFLAGCHLAREDFWKDQDNPQSFDLRARQLLRDQGNYARLPVQWAAGVKTYVHTDRSDVRDLVDELIPDGVVTDPEALDDLDLAVEIARDVGMAKWGDKNPRRTPEIVARLVQRLTEVRDGTLPIANRARAASAIGRFGDDRDGVGLDYGTKHWIKLPKGPFIMGSKAGEGFDTERPQMPKCGLIREDYSISRYPVTVAQYAAFVDDDGYAAKHETCWTKAGWQWRTKNKITGPRNDDDPVFQTPNHPRVGVSWYEAFAFCRWLTGKLRTAGRIEKHEVICLPTEAQWERAARHLDGRTYPWGNEDKAIAELCNMGNTGLNKTSAVALFSQGRAKCGAEDMAGNVWEWCLTPRLPNYAGYEAKAEKLEADLENTGARVVRGGSWINVHDTLRASYRYDYERGTRIDSLGFRCVLVGVAAGGWHG